MARGGIEVLVKKPLRALLLSKRAGNDVQRALEQGAFKIERAAKRAAPANYNILRAAIQSKRDEELVWSVGTRGLDYAKFVEFGTGPAGAASNKITAVAREAMQALGYKHGAGNFFPPVEAIALWAKRKGIPRELVFPIARAIGRRGSPAQPFLFPAFEKERQGIVNSVVRATRRALGVK